MSQLGGFPLSAVGTQQAAEDLAAAARKTNVSAQIDSYINSGTRSTAEAGAVAAQLTVTAVSEVAQTIEADRGLVQAQQTSLGATVQMLQTEFPPTRTPTPTRTGTPTRTAPSIP